MSSFFASISNRIKDVFKQGLTPSALAWSFTYGIIGGVFPIPGVTTLVCAFFTWMFSLNIAATQLANLLCTPLDLLLVVPFIRIGEAIFFVQHPVNAGALIEGLKSDFLATLGQFASSIIMAVCAWALVGAFAAPLLYILIHPLVTAFMKEAKK